MIFLSGKQFFSTLSRWPEASLFWLAGAIPGMNMASIGLGGQQESPLRDLIKTWRRPTFPPRTRIIVLSES